MPDPNGRPYLSEVVDQETIETFDDDGDTKLRATSRVPLQTVEAITLYVATTGSDSNAGTSVAPLLTWEAAEALIPGDVYHDVTINLGAGTRTLSRAFLFSRARTFHGDAKITVRAADEWDPAVYVTRVTGTAGGGTGVGAIVTSGLTLNAQRGYTLQMTSGDASGERRTIRNNSTTQLIPSVSFGASEGAVPASGDTFRVFSNAVIFSPPDGTFYLTPPGSPEDGSTDNIDCRYVIEGCTFDSLGAVYRGGYVVNANATFYGVRIEDNLRTEYGLLNAGDAARQAPASDMKLGWGVTCTGGFLYSQHAGRNEGCFVCAGYVAGHGWITAGFVQGGFHSTDQELESMSYSSYWGTVSLLMGTLTCYMGNRIWLYYVDFESGTSGPLVTLYGGDVMVSGTNVGESTGGVTIKVRSGGHVHLLSAPTLGSATAFDYDVGDGAPVNKAYFAGVNYRRHHEASLIERSF